MQADRQQGGYYVYQRDGAIDYMVRRNLGESFVDKGDETPGATWVRIAGPYATYLEANDMANGLERDHANKHAEV